MNKLCWMVSCAAGLMVAAPVYAFDGWHVESATTIESKTATFDYITFDASKNRLFLGHRKEGLQVFDLATKKVVKVIDNTPTNSSNGALLMPEFDLGIANNEDGTVTPFKISTLEAKAPVKLGEELDTSHYDPATKRIIVNMAANKDGTTDLIVLEAPSLKVVGKINVKTTKAEHAEADGNGLFYLASREPAKLFRIDTKEMKVTAEWDTPGCGQTNSLALDKANKRIFLGCRGSATLKPSFTVVNSDTGAVVFSTETGGGNDGVIFDPETKRIFLANGVGANIHVFEQVDANTYKTVEVLATRPLVKVLAYDAKNKKLFSMASDGTADFSKKVTPAVGNAFPPNTMIPNSFTVFTYAKN